MPGDLTALGTWLSAESTLSITDHRFDATAAGWARIAGFEEIAE
jgi:hypothetical protein